MHGPPKNRESKAPTISDPTHWVTFAEQFKAYAKNYGDAEKIISDEVEINYVHHALSQPNDIPSSLLLSYSQVAIDKDIQLLKKETPSSEEYPAQEEATTRSRQKSKLSAISSNTHPNITNTISLEDLNAQLLSSRLNEAIKAQSTLKTFTQALSLRLHEVIQGRLLTKMQETPTYRKAFVDNDLLNMWKILKQTCFAGFTDEAIQRFQSKFLKLKQESF